MDDENAKRISIDDLAKPEKELSEDEEKNVTGGGSSGIQVGMMDGSVRSISPGVSSAMASDENDLTKQ